MKSDLWHAIRAHVILLHCWNLCKCRPAASAIFWSYPNITLELYISVGTIGSLVANISDISRMILDCVTWDTKIWSEGLLSVWVRTECSDIYSVSRRVADPRRLIDKLIGSTRAAGSNADHEDCLISASDVTGFLAFESVAAFATSRLRHWTNSRERISP